jgi:DNA primase catalytic core
MTHNELNSLRELVRGYLPQYLQMNGINPAKQFKCLDPLHKDNKPSMGVLKYNPQLANCLSCHFVADIFDAAAILEHLPESGPEWVTGNLFYLANKFGLDIPKGNISNEENIIINIYRAYSHAAQIIRSSDISKLVSDKLKYYGWPKEIVNKLGIGSVYTYTDYIEKMTKVYKYSLEFLEKYDLANKMIFSPNNLIFVIKDDHGSPIGFSARDLNYEVKRISYEADKTIGKTNLFCPSKYINTNSNSIIYNKSKTLYLFNEAKKSETGAILIVEGQTDAVTCYSAGIKNIAGICSTAFTKEHLELLIANNIKHLIFLLDSDEAGQSATDKFINLIADNENAKDIRIEAIVLPNNQDPDSFIRSFENLKLGADALRKLPRIDSFTWRISKLLETGNDPITLCNRVLPGLLGEPNNVIKYHRIEQLAEITGQDKEYLKLELLRLIKEAEKRLSEEKSNLVKEITQSLIKIQNQFTLLFPNDIINVD